MELTDQNTINLFEVPVIGNYRLSIENDLIVQKFVDFITSRLCQKATDLNMRLFPHRISGDNYISIEITNKKEEEVNFLLHIRSDKHGPYWPEPKDWDAMRINFSLGDAIDSLFFIDELSRRLGINSN